MWGLELMPWDTWHAVEYRQQQDTCTHIALERSFSEQSVCRAALVMCMAATLTEILWDEFPDEVLDSIKRNGVSSSSNSLKPRDSDSR